MQNRSDVRSQVTRRIVEMLERGTRPWVQPWSNRAQGNLMRPLRFNGTSYRGINTVILWSEAADKGYGSSRWLTFKQAQEFGAKVRKGARGTTIFYTDRRAQIDTDEKGEEIETQRLTLRSYCVFNAEQIEGLPSEFYSPPIVPCSLVKRVSAADAFFHNTGAVIERGGNIACYVPSHDCIRMPPIEAFVDAECYYSTLAHEGIHWTKSPERLNRDFGCKRWGDSGYAMEELVAELGAAFLCADLDLSCEPREDHAAYLAHWLEVLKKDQNAIFSVASHAQRASDYLHSLQP